MSTQNQNQDKTQQQQDPNQKPGQQQQQQNPNRKPDQDEIRKAEIRKAAEQDKIDPDNPQGQQNTGFSGGT